MKKNINHLINTENKLINMSRIKPYTTNQTSWSTILQKNLKIPMNQREYSWEKDEIIKFLDDIFLIFEEGKYVEKMGSIINLNYNCENNIYDGQQRLLTTILIFYVIGCLSEKLKNKINQLLTIDSDLDELTDQQKKIKNNMNVNIIPKIYCINPFDMKGLVNIFNNNINIWVKNLDNLDNFEIFEEEEDYICKICKTKISRKSDFIRHLRTQHNFLTPNESTKLYNAYIEIYNYFVLKNYDEKKLIKLYKFILYDIDINFSECSSPEYVSRIFDWENNRGKAVETLDIIKNPILVQIPDDKRMEVYENWEKYKHKTNKIYKNFGQKIYDIAIQIYNNKIERKINHEEYYKKIINSSDTYKEMNKFFNIVKKLFEIMDDISKDKFGRLVNNTQKICLNWEAYKWCLLPIFYKKGNIDKNLLKLFNQWYYRNLQFKNRNFNNLCYSNEFIRIINEFLKDEEFDYYNQIKECLVKNKDISINESNYLNTMKDMPYKSTNAKYLLLFLETCENTDKHIVPLDYTLEHIYSQKNKDNLNNKSLINNIGNLTLLEGNNSDNGHKGNSSLGSSTYNKKVLSYNESSCKITRDITKKFKNNFGEEQIKERNKEIIELLNKHTNY